MKLVRLLLVWGKDTYEKIPTKRVPLEVSAIKIARNQVRVRVQNHSRPMHDKNTPAVDVSKRPVEALISSLK